MAGVIWRPAAIIGAVEGACILAGLAGYIMTDKLVWMAIGVVGGFGFSLPAIIELVRASKERNGA